MARENNVIGLAMNLDVADLKSGLKETKKMISDANQQFKVATAGMDNWSKSSEGLTAKLSQLNKNLDAQKKSVAGYEAEIARVSELEGDHSEQLENLKTKLQNAQIAVAKTEKEINKYNSSLVETITNERKQQTALSQLNNAIAEQESELASLNDEYTNAVLTYGRNSKEAKALANQIDSLSSELSDNKSKLDGASKSIDKLGDEAEESSSEVSGLKDALKNIGAGAMNGLKLLGGAVAGMTAGFFASAEATREFRNNMSKLETGFQQAGLSAQEAEKTYTDLYAVLGDEGKATEASAMIAKMAKDQDDLASYTRIATGVYATFGDSLPIEGLMEASNETAKTGKITGQLADALNWAGVSEDDFQEKLTACANETERTALITDTLNGLYGETADAFNEANKDIIESNRAQAELVATMGEIGAIAEPIMTKLKQFATDLLKTITPFVALIGEGLTGAIEGTAGSVDKLASGFSGIIETILNKITSLLPKVLEVLSALIPSVITMLLAQAPAIIGAITDVILQIVPVLLGLLPQLLSALIQIVSQLVQSIGNILPTIISKIVEIIPMLIEQLYSAIPMLIEAGIQLLMSLIQAVPVIIDQLLVAVPKIIDSIITGLITGIPLLIQGAIQLLMAIVDAIPVLIQSLVSALPVIIDTIVKGLTSALPVVLDGAIQLLMAIIKALPVIIKLLTKEMPTITTTIVKALTSNLPLLIQASVQLFGGIVKAIPMIIVELVKTLPSIIKSIVSGIVAGVPAMVTAGSDLIRGLWEGISNMADWIGQKITEFSSNVLGGIKKFFGIKSPSKVMAEMGNYIDEGLAKGITDGTQKVTNSATKMGKSLLKSVDGVLKEISDRDIANKIVAFGGKVDNPFAGWTHKKINAEADILNKKLKDINAQLIDNGVTQEQWGTSTESMNARAKILEERLKTQNKLLDAYNQKLAYYGNSPVPEWVSKGLEDVKNGIALTVDEAQKLNEVFQVENKTACQEFVSNFEEAMGTSADKMKEWEEGAGGLLTKISDTASGYVSKVTDLIGGVVELVNQQLEQEKNALDEQQRIFNETKDLEMAKAEESINSELAKNEEALANKEISEEMYASRKSQLEADLLKQAEQIELDKQKAEKETLAKKNELAKKQFKAQKANDIAQTIIAGALAIVQGFAQLGPIGGAINAALQAVITGVQVGVIASKQYVPMLAKGGIVSSPTMAMIGEDGQEAVMPLENNTGWISQLAEKLNAVMQKDFSLGGNDNVMQPAYAGATNVVNNYYQTINAPKTPTRQELYRDTKNLLSLKGV